MSSFFRLADDYTTATATAGSNGSGNPVFNIIWLALAVVGLWKCFSKAGEAGWKAIVPIYNVVIMLRLAGKPGWWFLLLLIPFVNIYFGIVFTIAFGKAYERSVLFSIIMLLFLSPIGLLIVGFGGSRYVGPGGSTAPNLIPAV